VKLQLRILTGPRAGVSGVFSQPEVTLGRHPACELQLDPDQDLDVSARHAVITRQGDRWTLRDLASRNGTLVNGHPIRAETRLDDTDQIRLGPAGPTVEVRLVSDGVADRRPAAPIPTADRPSSAPMRHTGTTPAPGPVPTHARRAPSTTQRIRVEVGRQTRRLRAVSAVLLLLLVAGGAYAVVSHRQQSSERARERAAWQARIDSIVRASDAAVQQLRGEVAGLADALRESQAQIQRLQGELRAAEGAGRQGDVARLRAELAAATAALSAQQAAALLDYRGIHQTNNRAVAMLWAEFAPGDVTTGTTFAVAGDGLMVTNRHVVYGPDGARRPRRLAVQFTNSAQVWRAQVVAASPDEDIAIIRVEGIVGAIPFVPVPDTAVAAEPGDPVAIIGFPFGTDLPMRSAGEPNLVRTTLTAGTLSKVLPDLLQIDGFGAQGASGSPVFNRDGTLLGVLYGGEPGTAGRVVYAIPVKYVTALLTQLGASSVR
jgi:S1-C subfamily serine protease/pSer/pThr/pTyr-binding forkhead associated (FHA) protein